MARQGRRSRTALPTGRSASMRVAGSIATFLLVAPLVLHHETLSPLAAQQAFDESSSRLYDGRLHDPHHDPFDETLAAADDEMFAAHPIGNRPAEAAVAQTAPVNSDRDLTVGIADSPLVDATSPDRQSPDETQRAEKPGGRFAADVASRSLATQADGLLEELPSWLNPKSGSSPWTTLLLVAALSLAPAAALMTTSFVRIAVVLGLLRQALGTQQLPSNQVLTALALFLTILIMTPVWTDSYHQSIEPYNDPQNEMSLAEAWQRGIQPVRRFMIRQIEIAGNYDDVLLLQEYAANASETPAATGSTSGSWSVGPAAIGSSSNGAPAAGTQTVDDFGAGSAWLDQVPLQVLLPAFVISELKTAFLIGFQVYLPFLILDLVVSAVTVSTGMMMLPPTTVSLPFKLMLFVLVDGWRLVVGMLLDSFGPLV